MKNKPDRFFGLHAHSGFSTFDGLGYPNEHMDFCLQNGLDGWALTDHGHMNGFGYAQLHADKLRSKGVNFKFIPGCEMYVHPSLETWQIDYDLRAARKRGDSQAEKILLEQREQLVTPIHAVTDGDDEVLDVGLDEASLTVENEEETKSAKFYDPIKRRHHLVVLPKTSVGLQRLFSLVSKGYTDGFYRFPRVDYKMLREAASGGHLMVSTACLGGPLSYEVFRFLQNIEFDNLSQDLLNDESISKKITESISNSYDDLSFAMGNASGQPSITLDRSLPCIYLSTP